MKNYKINILIFVLFTIFNPLLAEQFEFTPININYSGIEVKQDTIIAYGDYGSLIISYDGGAKWRQLRIFEKGKIQMVFWNDDGVTAFSDEGEIAISKDKAGTWTRAASLHDSVLAVIRYPDGYFIRSDKKLITLSDSFVKKKETPMISKPLDVSLPMKYKYSLAYFKDMLIAETDISRFIRFDRNLQPVDTIKLDSLGLTRYMIQTDSDYFYFRTYNSIYRSNDLKSYELIIDSLTYCHLYKIIEDNLYILNYYRPFSCKLYKFIKKDSINLLNSFVLSGFSGAEIKISDFGFGNKQLFVSGNAKILVRNASGDSTAHVISSFIRNSEHTCPYQINDSTFFISSRYNTGLCGKYFFLTYDNCITMKPTINWDSFPGNQSFYKDFSFEYFDDSSNTVYLGSGYRTSDNSGVRISKDFCRSFVFKSIPGFVFSSIMPIPKLEKLVSYPNIQKRNDNLIVSCNVFDNRDVLLTKIITYDLYFNQVSNFLDSNYAIDYVYSKDTNTFLVHCLKHPEHYYEIKNTTNKGKNWEIVKNYNVNDSLVYYKELKYKGKPMLLMLYMNALDSICTLEALDIEDRSVQKLFEFKKNIFDEYIPAKNGMDIYNDTLYFSVDDTLFYTNDIYNLSLWNYYILPDNGRIYRTFKRYGNNFYANYADDKNARGLYWIKIKEDEYIPEPPDIAAGDCNFGDFNIRETDYKTKSIAINNLSKDKDLLINSFTESNNLVFETDLPENGAFDSIVIKPGQQYKFNVTFKPDSAKFFSDSIVFHSNAHTSDSVAYLYGQGIDTVRISVDAETEEPTYIYIYPPKPVPSTSHVRALIYFDPRIVFDLNKVGVTDVNGSKVEGNENISLERLSPYSGYLNWNCSRVGNGVYFIHIRHGNNARVVKVIVSR